MRARTEKGEELGWTKFIIFSPSAKFGYDAWHQQHGEVVLSSICQVKRMSVLV